MKLPNWFKITWWIFLLCIVSSFIFKQYSRLTTGTATTADILIFLIWTILCLFPLFEEFNFLGITLKKEVEQLKSDVLGQINSLRSEIKNTVNFQVTVPSQGQVLPEKEEKPLKRSPMEYKILNTLWTKQVNKFPTLSAFFTFTIFSNSSEYFEFREAGSKLIGERLVGQTDTGQYLLTPTGWDWCKKNYLEFPPDQWWPEETIIEENLKKVLDNK